MRAQFTSSSEKAVFFYTPQVETRPIVSKTRGLSAPTAFMGNLSDSAMVESTRSSRDASREAAPCKRGNLRNRRGRKEGRNEHTHRVSARKLHREEPALSSLPPNESRVKRFQTHLPAGTACVALPDAAAYRGREGTGTRSRSGRSVKVRGPASALSPPHLIAAGIPLEGGGSTFWLPALLRTPLGLRRGVLLLLRGALPGA